MPAAEVLVEEVTEPTPAHAEALERLLPQLSTSAATPGLAELGAMLVPGNGIRLFAAQLGDEGTPGGRLVGFAVLAVFTSLTGRRAWLEDVVVDGEARNHGIGSRLVHAVAEAAAQEGCRTLDLTSRPSREAANRLYERCGFVRRATNVWRLELAP